MRLVFFLASRSCNLALLVAKHDTQRAAFMTLLFQNVTAGGSFAGIGQALKKVMLQENVGNREVAQQLLIQYMVQQNHVD